jgi:hypothetical protein
MFGALGLDSADLVDAGFDSIFGDDMEFLANATGQPGDELLSKTEGSRAIALRCYNWLG